MATAVVVGASSGVGRSLARSLAEAGHQLVLISRDARDLEATAADLSLRFAVKCWPMPQDIADSAFDALSFCQRCEERCGQVDVLLVPAGGVDANDTGANPGVIEPLLALNFSGPAKLASAFGARMAARRGGSIVLFSSIAAAAPRTKNLAYAAAKAALEAYAVGLRHALFGQGVEVTVVRLGYVDTPQSFGMKLLFPVVTPQAVARHVLQRGSRNGWRGTRNHYPRFWWWITTCLSLLPWPIYRRLKF